MIIEVNGRKLKAELQDNSSALAVKELLKNGPVSIDMKDYANMEKFGSFGKKLPRNDKQITTQAGDIILSEGHLLVIYYAPNSWNFTRLGKIQGLTAAELRQILGKGDVSVTLSLADE